MAGEDTASSGLAEDIMFRAVDTEGVPRITGVLAVDTMVADVPVAVPGQAENIPAVDGPEAVADIQAGVVADIKEAVVDVLVAEAAGTTKP